MKKELQDKIFSKYPKIFKQKDLPMTQTAMCWGLDCGDGWFDIIDRLCDAIQSYTDNNQKSQVEAIQVKEKYGCLEFYTDNSDDYIQGMIALARNISQYTCEECGSKGELYEKNYWWRVRCENCKKNV